MYSAAALLLTSRNLATLWYSVNDLDHCTAVLKSPQLDEILS